MLMLFPGITLAPNHFHSIEAALDNILPGDTVILSNGHHWESSIQISVPVRIRSESIDPSRCIIELTGALSVSGHSNRVSLSGVTIRRPKKVSGRAVCVSVDSSSYLSLINCHVNNDGALGATISVRQASLQLFSSIVKGGSVAGVVALESILKSISSKIIQNDGCGVLALDSFVGIEDSYVMFNGKQQLSIHGSGGLILSYSEVRACDGHKLTVDIDDDCLIENRGCIGDEDFLMTMSNFSWKRRHEKLIYDIADDESEEQIGDHYGIIDGCKHRKLFLEPAAES